MAFAIRLVKGALLESEANRKIRDGADSGPTEIREIPKTMRSPKL